MVVFENAADAEKFEKIYSEFRDYMYCVALSVLRDRQVSEDVVKQAFEYISQNLDQFGNGRSLYGVREQVARLVVRGANGNWDIGIVQLSEDEEL